MFLETNVIPPDSKIENKNAKNGGFAHSTSSQTELSCRNDTITVFSSQLTKLGEKGKVEWQGILQLIYSCFSFF